MAIINLEKTLICLRRAYNLIESIIRAKGHFLLVNTNPEYNKIIQQMAASHKCSNSVKNWLDLLVQRISKGSLWRTNYFIECKEPLHLLDLLA